MPKIWDLLCHILAIGLVNQDNVGLVWSEIGFQRVGFLGQSIDDRVLKYLAYKLVRFSLPNL